MSRPVPKYVSIKITNSFPAEMYTKGSTNQLLKEEKDLIAK
jgi:hypothetical protein